MKSMACLVLLSLCLLASVPAGAAPNPADFGVAVGSTHKICLGAATQLVKTLKIGKDGWILVEALPQNGFTLGAGEKYWINLDRVVCVSAPFGK